MNGYQCADCPVELVAEKTACSGYKILIAKLAAFSAPCAVRQKCVRLLAPMIGYASTSEHPSTYQQS